MAWADSRVFRPMVANVFGNVEVVDHDADTFMVALYDNDITPDNDVTTANSCYNAGQWTSAGNEVFEAGQWAQGGVAITGQSLNSATADVVFFDANDTASGSAADLAAVFGCLVYDTTATTPDDQGVSYNYFGGSNSVVNGTFTVVWHTDGIWRATLT